MSDTEESPAPESGHDAEPPDPRSAPGGRGLDPVGAVVGTLVGLSGALFLLQAGVGFLVVGPLAVRPVVLSAVTMAVAMLVGGVLFGLGGRRTLAIGHGGTGAGWALLVTGTFANSGLALLLGAGLVGGTALFLVADRRRA